MKKFVPVSVLVAMSAVATPALAQDTVGTGEAVGMGLIAWLIVGLIAGYLASRIVNRRGEGLLLDIVLGIVGAWIGGFIFRAIGSSGVTGFNLWSILVAFVGAVVLLVIYHAISGQRHRTA